MRWPLVATGNWGCGAFGGYVPVKAVVAFSDVILLLRLRMTEGDTSLRLFAMSSARLA